MLARMRRGAVELPAATPLVVFENDFKILSAQSLVPSAFRSFLRAYSARRSKKPILGLSAQALILTCLRPSPRRLVLSVSQVSWVP
jgi:hypothetical protein